ncbi:MAG: DUF4982 domain-containing protein [Firmicutes bacterium]|nr:DUF4982 domain-containing protein [Bacillota bacterium]
MRETIPFNQGWSFRLEDEDTPRAVTLPHDWSVEYDLSEASPTGGGGGYAKAGVGIYETVISSGAADKIKGHEAYLQFEGVYMDSTVYYNGDAVASHKYGYTPFIVPLCDVSEGDVIRVRVDNSHQPNSRWYTGSGIYRNVSLVIHDGVHIVPWGIKCMTSRIYPERGSADLLISAEICAGEEDVTAGVYHEIYDAEGKCVSSSGIAIMLRDGEVGRCEVRPQIKSAHLWSDDDPYLYTLITRVKVSGEVIDEAVTKIGIRTATFDADRGFLLNGRSVKIKGMCLHHDSGLFGAASCREVWERRLSKLRDMGCNGIRCSHNPPDPLLLDLCDEMGFLVMDEAFDEWYLTKHKNNNYYSEGLSYGSGMFFDTDAESDLRLMIRRDYNHPSVVLWSIGNEIPEQSSADGADIVRFLQGICHEEDISRMVTCACDNIASGSTACAMREFENALDVVGYNYVGRWRERAETFYDEDRRLYPARRFCGSENPSAGGDRGVYRKNGPFGGYDTATLGHEALWRYTASRDFVAGDFLWTGIDYLGETRWPRRGAGCGAIDTAGFEKDSYYYFRSIWNSNDVTLHLLPHWNHAGSEGEFIRVVCYTNCDEAELFINGKSAGRRGLALPPRTGAVNNWYERSGVHATTNDLHLVWDIPYEAGELRAVGYKDEKEAAVTVLETVGDAVSLSAKAWHDEAAPGEIIQIEVEARDEAGRFTPLCGDEVQCVVTGPAEYIGMDSGDLSDLSKMNLPARKLHAGKLFCAVRCTGEGGICVKFTSEHLTPAVVKVIAGFHPAP